MNSTVPTVHELDLGISVAFIALGSARSRFDRCPSAENERRVADAEAEVDRLLDQRLAVRAAAA
jgi:hypothetical protein